MQTELALVVLVPVVAVAALTALASEAAARRLRSSRMRIAVTSERLERDRGTITSRTAELGARSAALATGVERLGERLVHADAVMDRTARQLHDGRASVDAATRDRLVPLAQWFGRVVAIGRLWRMQREMWRG